MHKLVPVLTTAAVLWIAGTSQASVSFNFQEHGTGVQGYTKTFTESGLTITAQAYQNVTLGTSYTDNLVSVGNQSSNPSTNQLYAKNAGTGEIGLGLASDTSGQFEITKTYGILIDLTGSGISQPYTITFESVTGGEREAVYDAVTGAYLNSSNANGTITIGSGTSGKFLITETASSTPGNTRNVLLGAVTVTAVAVPEPGTLVTAFSALVPLALFGWSRRRKVAA